MKTTTLFSALALIMALTASSVTFAQVKIGTNPTTIEPNSNLEVEASTPGRKMKVDKTTGQVSIADGTQGAGKVFTSDAVGNGSWQAAGPSVYVEASNTGAQTIVGGSGFNKIIMPTEVADIGNNYNPATSEFTVPATGYYMIMGRTTKSTTDNVSGHNMSFVLRVNGALATQHILDALPGGEAGVAGFVHFQGTTFGLFNAGDVLELSLRSLDPSPTADFIMNYLKIVKLF
ncbi:hypothetical protein GCM10007423_63310 [Dyadobacter endophyticus]|uniref:C1q domain-containing protein n=1 Tax=Dyadobacter endophyticus TaxID=1749036 RepID=A0ABQ1ZE12_9BACT|nr:hypothetical protein [Dyadobacter endophyticus]GGH55605.1 hypothetical protein GCM10007423_63310 [Dyadobacter endophyticus]